MGDFRLSDGCGAPEAYGFTSGGTLGLGVSSTTAWQQIAAATLRDCTGIWVSLSAPGAGSSAVVMIGVGASGSEVPIITGIPISGNAGGSTSVFWPICIPAGTQISAKCSTSYNVGGLLSIALVQEGFASPTGFSKVTELTSPTGVGVTVTSSSTFNTMGAWSELIASTTDPISQLIILGSATSAMLDVSVGASGSEYVVVSNMLLGKQSFTGFTVPVSIPAGSRLAARIAGGVGSTQNIQAWGVC